MACFRELQLNFIPSSEYAGPRLAHIMESHNATRHDIGIKTIEIREHILIAMRPVYEQQVDRLVPLTRDFGA
jgi:hypothetical protein